MSPQPRLGIALGGGGARGFAHLGVLRVLRDNGIEPQIVTGTSIGALAGAAFASEGLERLERAAGSIRARDVLGLLSPAWSAHGLFSGRNILRLLNEVLTVKNIEDMPRRFAAIATDLRLSELVTFTRGDVSTAVRASISVPGAFTPVVVGERILVDGGILEPLPVRAARELGAEVVIAVDLFRAEGLAPLRTRRSFFTFEPEKIHPLVARLRTRFSRRREAASAELRSIFDVLVRTLAVSQAHLTTLRLEHSAPDFIIAPEVGATGFADFHRSGPIRDAGARAAKESIPQILSLLQARGIDCGSSA